MNEKKHGGDWVPNTTVTASTLTDADTPFGTKYYG